MAFGRFQGAIAAVLYWVTNPLWVGGSLAFIATEAWNDNIFKIHAGGAGDYLFKFLFIWLSIGVAIVSLKRGKWIPNLGALMRIVVLLGLFTITTIIYAIKHGVDGFPVSDLKPTGAIFLALVPLLLFNYVGFELQNGAAEEMDDPQKDVPRRDRAQRRSSACCSTRSRSSRSSLVLPAEKVTGIGGFLDAVTETFTVYGGASELPARRDDAVLRRHPADLGRGVDDRLATGSSPWPPTTAPSRASSASSTASSARRCASTRCRASSPRSSWSSPWRASTAGPDAKFVVVLTIAISTTLISYLWVFPAALKLRYTHGHVHRPYRVPGGLAPACGSRRADDVLDRAGQLRRRLPGHAREPLRDRLRLQGRRGASAARPTRR